MKQTEKNDIMEQCKTCRNRKRYADGGCHKFKGGEKRNSIKNIMGTTWIDKDGKCKLYSKK